MLRKKRELLDERERESAPQNKSGDAASEDIIYKHIKCKHVT